ncbi:MAG: endonuclease/exonuclease/phosphatase family protein [Muribaculaceae bacterium]|nr:endonuclease/exonuclease/phosphatase family protein [Muribaculaceae bacterium]
MRGFRKAINALMVIVNLVIGVCLVFTAYAGNVSPIEHPKMGVVVLSFPIWLAAIAFLLILDLVWWRKTSLIAICSIMAAWPLVWDTCPLNIGGGIPSGTPPERIFTVMTYNVQRLLDFQKQYPDSINPTVTYILREDPDIVCLQELSELAPNKRMCLTQSQIDSLHARYPYIILSGKEIVTMSKFPLESIHLDMQSRQRENFCDIGAYVVNIEGHRLALFSLHMQSYRFTKKDKSDYLELTRMQSEEDLKEVRHTLMQKLEQAAVHRADQAEMLGRYIDFYGGENVLVCGDFNDVPGCYTLHCLADHGMKEVWSEAAFGPTYTYFDNRFYFRIDHMLWRGRFQPAGIRRGKSRTSDHAPLIATFVWDEDADTPERKKK